MEKRTKIILIVAVLLIIGIAVALVFGLLLSRSSTIKLEVWPRPDENSDAPLIQYRSNYAGSWLTWSTRVNDFLKEYRQDSQQPLPQYTGGAERVPCTYDKKVLGDKQVCDVNLESYFPCTLNNVFQSTSPCLFFRLNKISNWTPVPYNKTVGLPQNMPKDLREYIGIIRNAPESNNVWLTCEGEDPADKEFIGPLEYIPRRGFPAFYFPYTNKEGYLSPMVAVRFQRPRTGVLIKVVCTAWAKNIRNDKDEQQGTIHVSLQID